MYILKQKISKGKLVLLIIYLIITAYSVIGGVNNDFTRSSTGEIQADWLFVGCVTVAVGAIAGLLVYIITNWD
jgi:hypothetical protein